jgi:hypothetical protein
MTAFKRVVVRYEVKPEHLEEHERLLRRVFEELATVRPSGIAYQALKLEDGRSFVHLATVTTSDGRNPVTELAAFKAFAANIADRCAQKPVTTTAIPIGAYG